METLGNLGFVIVFVFFHMLLFCLVRGRGLGALLHIGAFVRSSLVRDCA